MFADCENVTFAESEDTSMNEQKIKRINELERKSKAEGMTEE